MSSVYWFLGGALTLGFWVAGLFFFRFWGKTHDRFFAIFALAFWALGVERLVLLGLGSSSQDEEHTLIYLIRLAAFIMILVAIVDKNRSNRS